MACEARPLAQSPPFQGNLRARYEWSINEYQAFVQLGAAHQAHSLSLTGNAPSIAPTGSITQAFDQPAFTTYDGALGVSKDAWNVQVFGQNLTDTRGSPLFRPRRPSKRSRSFARESSA